VPLKLSWVVWSVVLLSALVLILPILSTLLIYKMLANLCLQGRILDGRDAVWALDADEEASLAVINILAIVDGDVTVQKIKQVVVEKLVPTHPKLKRLRSFSPLGYFFWKKHQVRIILLRIYDNYLFTTLKQNTKKCER